MIELVSRIISKIKHREYKIDPRISTGILIMIVLERAMMVFRGLFHKPLFRKAEGVLFVGRNVKIRAHRCMEIKSGFTIHDGCYINALCKGGVHIGVNFSLGRGSTIECTGVIRDIGEELRIGDDVGIAANAFISVRGPISIGSSTIFGPGVQLFAENHNYDDLKVPIFLQGATRKGIVIGEDCWIGAGATILDGVRIGNKVVVAAGAVITKDVQDNAVVGGIPAKALKMRSGEK